MASANDPFQFQEFEESNLLATASNSTAINIEDDFINQKSLGGSVPSGDEDPMEEDDKAELLSGEKKSPAFWSFEYYQQFFNVDTRHVTERIVGSMLPWPGKNFVHVYLRRNPDLYGPFWICTTLVFAIAISGNLSTFLVNLGKPSYKYTPEFGKVSIAATAIFSYAWLVPLAVWGFLLWRNNKIMNLVSYSFIEIVCVYGYSLSIYIPAVVLWIIPVEWVRWLTIVVALCLSGSVLVITFWPAVRDDKPKVIVAVMSAVVMLNALLAVGCKMYFFSEEELLPPRSNLSTTPMLHPHTT
ncbi:protein YIPF1 isoform X2 [Syngnathus typhle]|nr:protein YIPF1 isoform X2 [Syngnathus typhle]XP_061150615.1 protein YIPF1 isoform X2 [Syngnathus typhle]XP_061150616.1 protein YIPF1 isoform X2 [Syngnathus typhle]XP_061150617.1 protein YIPF1 isoform X2 [Syngnathus typhle]XP_061150618.1 protein YIPF1 isoform X2 [Syngnathus typhle]XP_061150619.1 protein YIPF1 isoform X2 [Syngnathus typhle]XP_061150620.1 protein YIPF1 isoform X2 [Syngnathus typhle]